MSAVGDARKRLTQANAPRDDLAARIVHRLTCTRCAQGWSCGGLGEGDYAAAGEIAGLLAEVRGEERERVAQAIEAVRSPSLSLTEIGHLDHAARIARTEAGS